MQTPYTHMIACMAIICAPSLVNAAQEQLVRCREHHSVTECDIKKDRSQNIMERYIQKILRQHRLCHQLNHHSPLYKLPTALMYGILQYVGQKYHLQETISCALPSLRHGEEMQTINETIVLIKSGLSLYTFNLATKKVNSLKLDNAFTCYVIKPDTLLLIYEASNCVALYNYTSQAITPLPSQAVSAIPLPQNICALGTANGAIDLWNIDEHQLIKTLEISQGNSDAFLVNGVSLGNTLLAGIIYTEFNLIKIWNTDTAKLQCSLKGHSKRILTLTPLTSTQFTSGSDDASIKLWDIEKALCIQTSPVDTSGVITLLALEDAMIAAGYRQSLIKLWDMRSNTYIQTLSGHTRMVNSLVKMNSNRFASCSNDGTVKIWDIRYDIDR